MKTIKNILLLLFVFLTVRGYTQTTIQYHPDKTKAAEGNMVNGQKQGSWKYWNEQGKLVATKDYRNDTLNGYVKFYNDPTMLHASEQYQMGIKTASTTYKKSGEQVFLKYYTNGQTMSRKEHTKEYIITTKWNEKGQLLNTDSVAVKDIPHEKQYHTEMSTAGDDIAPVQETSKRSPDSTYYYEMPDKFAEYPGGKTAMVQYFEENLVYPDEKSKEYSGKVYLELLLSPKGTIEKVTVKKGLYPPLDQEAVKAAEKMPAWAPAQIKGQPVRSRIVIPVTFKP